jgi:hypothetical protein
LTWEKSSADYTHSTLRFVASPGKAVVAFRPESDRYPIAREASTIGLPDGLSLSNFQAFATIDPNPSNVAVTVTLTPADTEGRLQIECLAPGLKYDLARSEESEALHFADVKWADLAFASLVLKLGGILDMADVRIGSLTSLFSGAGTPSASPPGPPRNCPAPTRRR